MDAITVSLQPSFFLDNRFNIRSVNTKTFILLLAQKEPRSFISGTRVSLRSVLKTYNSKEFHHINPRAFVATLTEKKHDVNCLTNFCIISKTDNNQLAGDKPSIYRTKMADNVEEILNSAICDASVFDDDFDEFIENRTIQLMEIAENLMNTAST